MIIDAYAGIPYLPAHRIAMRVAGRQQIARIDVPILRAAAEAEMRKHRSFESSKAFGMLEAEHMAKVVHDLRNAEFRRAAADHGDDPTPPRAA